MTEEAKSVRVQPIPKECDAETFRNRMDLFRVVMLAKGNRVALKNNPMLPVDECDVDDIEDTETDYKKKRKAVEKNMSTMTYLTMLCLDNVKAKTALEKSKTDEWPTGIASKAIEYLEAAFIAEDITAKKLRDTLSQIEYKDEKVKPEVFISQVQRVKNLNKEIKKKEERVRDKEFVEHVIDNAPKVYVTALVEAREKAPSTYGLDDAEKTMHKIWKPLYGKDEKVMALQDIEDEQDTEVALFEGVCYGCGESGHKKVNCPSKGKGNKRGGYRNTKKGKRFNGTCHNCGKHGHKRDDCFELEKNASKRPANWKSSKKDTAMVASDVEYALVTHDTYQGICREPPYPKCSGICKKLKCHVCICCKGHHHAKNKCQWKTYLMDSGAEGFKTYAAAVKSGVSDDTSDSERAYVAIEELDEDNTALETAYAVSSLEDDTLWIGDTGASVHFKTSSKGMVLEGTKQGTAEGAAGPLRIEGSGDYPCKQIYKDGSEGVGLRLTNVQVSKTAKVNLFSITQAISQGFKLESKGNGMILTKGNCVVKFDIPYRTKSGVLFCARLQPRNVDTAFDAVDTTPNIIEDDEAIEPSKSVPVVVEDTEPAKSKKKIPIAKAHAMFGHQSEKATRKIAKALSIELSRGNLIPCEDCAKAKAKQKDIKKVTFADEAEKPKEKGRYHLDLAVCKVPTKLKFKSPNPNWLLIVDEYSGLKTTRFYPTKDAMAEDVCELFHQWQALGRAVKIVRCDGAGENLLLEQRAKSKDWKLGIVFEYTGRNTPQRNSLVEVGFPTIAGRARAMLSAANLPLKIRYKVFNESLATATLYDGLNVVVVNNKAMTRFQHSIGTIPRCLLAPRIFGEAGVIKTRVVTTGKAEDRGTKCMFVGYNLNCGDDVYRMWNPSTERVSRTRDVRWLNRMYYPNESLEVREAARYNLTPSTSIEAKDAETEDKAPTRKPRRDPVREESNVISTNAVVSDDESDDDDDDYDSDVDCPGLLPRGDSSVISSDSESDSDSDSDDESEDESPILPSTRSGRIRRAPVRFKDYGLGLVNEPYGLHDTEAGYYATMTNLLDTDVEEAEPIDEIRRREYALVGAGIGGGFQNTNELRVMTYDEAMSQSPEEVEKWQEAVETEYGKMQEYKVFQPVPIKDIPEGTKVLTSTWAMKKKANGVHRARMVARGFEQRENVHFDPDEIASPVTNDMSIRIVMVLALMANWVSHIVDVKGAFLHGEYGENEEPVYMEVPQGFQRFFPEDVVLLLLKTLYGLKQAAKAFWKELLKAMKFLGFEKSTYDPCMYFKWNAAGFLIIWLSWIDDCACFGRKHDVKKETRRMKKLFDHDDVGSMNEYVGCKVDRKSDEFKFTQPVMLQSFEDEFELNDGGTACDTPGDPGKVLPVAAEEEKVVPKLLTYFRKGVGKLLHMMRWSRPEIYNPVRDLSRHMKGCAKVHIRAMHRVMRYCVKYPNRGWRLKPNRKWNGKDRTFKFKISGRSDSDYANCPTTRRSVTGYSVFLEGAPIMVKSLMQKIVALSVTEAEINAGVACAQEMIFAMRILNSLGLQVELPMVLEIDNKGAVDHSNNFSVGGRTKHMEVKQLYLRQLKENGLLKIKWLGGDMNDADLFTKNLPAASFNKHAKIYCGEDVD